MRRIRSYLIGVEQGSQVLFSDFEHDGDMWTGTGPREFRTAITFDEAFAEPPAVQVSMSMWDLDHKSNPRADISAENVTRSGFEIVFRTWADTRVARVRCDWMALGEAPDDAGWDAY